MTEQEPVLDDPDYISFVRNIERSTGINLADYKETQMKRRLTTLRMKKGFGTFSAFYDAMMKDKPLFHEFLDRMTINVSEFWRNPNRWEVFRDKILPELSHQNPGVLKIWSAACSTGEEPYTLAMILAEQKMLNRARIVATDIDDGALHKAAEGLYVERSLKDVPPDIVLRYFKEEGSLYRFNENLKKEVAFHKQNLLTDRFEGGYDLIVCRNVMIYFTEGAKHKLYTKFANSLKPGGFLFVGSTEQIFNPGQYGLESNETFFYRKVQ
ncbi:protein-glutamate O-methyltransferase CheR [Paenibacillus glucanolyticus]|jgi:chemotaxis protein methyltransferase CheR|uniref:CheR family methyltransferase n=1 Tax=Paenibacillus TaxID=44249 RepID=UPI0003E2989E|nr:MULTISPECIES: protein-glutamate O-methyltransferase CheR [Paenibacillus]ANA82041.1 chemotaxis protein CheR [Paenibacillus glucanolyticus]AVV59221.1 protein-glutamate O-methyltransferase CheR [Paenibacillus glucanolyticus]ETT43478.1 CheR-type MCP methyltransferase [Paenibacillus sp. FSL R5-808]MPY16257.1 protein-glutamate O-methyltransferase CheR [Paenibacillus glucanolyticus]